VFDVGFWEISLISVLALIIIGPERLPGVARTAGTWLGKARRMMSDIKSDIKSELDESELDEIKNIGKDIQEAGQAFKSQLESGEEKLKSEGSSMDNAIADALNKPMTTADPNWAYPTDDTPAKPEKKQEKASVKKKTTRKKTASKKAASKKKAATRKVASNSTAKKSTASKKKISKKKTADEKDAKKTVAKTNPKPPKTQTS